MKENSVQKPSDEEIANEDQKWPNEDDCFEFKLVGVVQHSGSANAGHYWSYINTKRGTEETDIVNTETETQWGATENDEWLEFNDSNVREYNFNKLKDDAFGGESNKIGISSEFMLLNSRSETYGKSAYMLVYERKLKRSLVRLTNPGVPVEEEILE